MNGKYYTGCHQTYNLDDGYLGSGVALLQAVKKYGKGSFKRTLIGQYPTREAMIEAEKLHVNHKDPMSYNLCPGGIYVTDEGLQKRADINTGKTHSPETRKKISDSHTGKTHSLEARKRMSDAHTGKTLSDAHRCKLRASNIGRKPSPETRKKISEGGKGRVVSPETRKKISKAVRAHYADLRA